MATAKALRANAQHDETVRNALDILKNLCGYDRGNIDLSWERQALRLALRRSYSRRDISYRYARGSDAYFSVRADSQPGHVYSVIVHQRTYPECSCLAGQHQRPCKHAGIALGLWAETVQKRAQLEQVEREAAQLRDELAHLSREDRREMAAIAIRFHEGREGRW